MTSPLEQPAVTTIDSSTALEPTFRFFREDDLEAVFELIQVAFGPRWPNLAISVDPSEHLRWKLSGPRRQPGDTTVVVIGDRIIGYVGGSSRDYWLQGERARGWYGGDYCIHPDFQERGLVRPWREWRDAQELPDSVGLSEGSTHRRLVRSSKRRNSRVLVANKVDRLTLPFNLSAIARGGGTDGNRTTTRSLFRAARTGFRMLVTRARWRPFSEACPAIEIDDVTSFDERADRLWERARGQFDLTVMRDREHLNWRYCDPRAGVYRVRAVEDGGELAGFMVTAAVGDSAQIVDLLVEPGNERALRALIEDAIALAQGDGATSLTLLMPRHHAYRETFRRSGFVVGHQVTNMGFSRDYILNKSYSMEFLATDRNARIHVALGDSDHI